MLCPPEGQPAQPAAHGVISSLRPLRVGGRLSPWGNCGMSSLLPRAETRAPQSIIEGVERAVLNFLAIKGLRHRSARPAINDPQLVETIHQTISDNYARAGASANKDRSRENWRWPSLQTRISQANASPEVIVERAIAAACQRLRRTDWGNQVPVASGLIPSAREGRRAIDLVCRRGERHFELIELKIASDTPLYAAIEIICYSCLWIIARNDRPTRNSPLLDADKIDLRVLAPAAFYAGFETEGLETALDLGVRTLGRRNGAMLTFAFRLLDERVQSNALPADAILLECLDHAPSATAVQS
jgi:hypothetical protein